MGLLILGVAALAGAVPLVVMGVWSARAANVSRRDAVGYLRAEGAVMDRSRRRFLTGPLATSVGRVLPSKYLEWLRDRLAQAGAGRGFDGFLAGKAVWAAAGAAVGLVLSAGSAMRPLAMALGALAGFAVPDVLLSRRAERRIEEIRRALPESIDLMAITLEAGVGLEGAMARAADDVGGPLAEEYRRVLHEMRLGSSRREALRALKARVRIPEVSSFVLALLHADSIGMPVGKVLKVQSAEMRTKRRQRAREQAAKAPVKIVFPLVFGIFPAMLVVILGPALIRIVGALVTS